ncbi:hypothetical protein [Paenibacillus sp. RC343]|nr:hypothetical protein [Paenibacillus sp. RC343]
MYWIYYGRLYTTKFQAGCLAKKAGARRLDVRLQRSSRSGGVPLA